MCEKRTEHDTLFVLGELDLGRRRLSLSDSTKTSCTAEKFSSAPTMAARKYFTQTALPSHSNSLLQIGSVWWLAEFWMGMRYLIMGLSPAGGVFGLCGPPIHFTSGNAQIRVHSACCAEGIDKPLANPPLTELSVSTSDFQR